VQQFDFVAALVDKDKHIAIAGIPAKGILHQAAQAIEAFSHIG
jgi:hypothetical protein